MKSKVNAHVINFAMDNVDNDNDNSVFLIQILSFYGSTVLQLTLVLLVNGDLYF